MGSRANGVGRAAIPTTIEMDFERDVQIMNIVDFVAGNQLTVQRAE